VAFLLLTLDFSKPLACKPLLPLPGFNKLLSEDPPPTQLKLLLLGVQTSWFFGCLLGKLISI
jgi:hypothetical protein